MQNWEPFNIRSNTCKDDPWDLSAQKRRERRQGRRVEAHTAETNHHPGECDEMPTVRENAPAPPPRKPPAAAQPADAPVPHRPQTAPRRRRSPLPIIIIAVILGLVSSTIIPVIIENVSAAAQIFGDGDDFSVSEEPEDDFSEDVDPDTDFFAEEDSAVSESYIEPYDGSTEFRLQLNTAAGLDELSYQEIYASVSPSVVTLTVYSETSGAYATGIILTEDGYILTNQHVVGGEDYCEVTTYDNSTYTAQLVGEDPNSDLAVIKIEAENLTPAQFGNSEELTVGDECFAIGNPLGIRYRGTFTNGIISALNRSVSVNDYSMTLIQTTAAVNSGNSGGPLINSRGQVVGVVNMKIMSSSTTVEGLGFAIPTTTVQKVVNSILDLGYAEHPVIGITCYSVSASYDDTEVTGLLVNTVDSNSDAFTQGLNPGDIITEVNGIPVSTVADVSALLEGLHVGDSITLTLFHEDGTTEYMDISLVESNDLAGD